MLLIHNLICKRLRDIASLMVAFFVLVPVIPLEALQVPTSNAWRPNVVEASSPKCTAKLLWYTKGSQICAPTRSVGIYKWQASMKKSDTTKFMNTCRSFFATAPGQLLCDWMQKYVNNILLMKGPRDNCLTYWKNLLDNAALVAQTNKSATVGSAITPYSAKYSGICHP